ncbi:MAG: hypothetical protein B6242_07020 [Anaerolineaceae bacterium 4572_78]|nr:MAG: hypothetical protein B6242_07020 [Anaerolineaceae bacterium 4572_78]
MLVHPNFVEYSKDLILALLKMLNVLQLDNVYCTLRTYQFELEPALVACGFKQIASQIVMVKHIPVRAKDFLPQFIVSVGKQVEVKSALPIKKRFNSSSAVMRLDGAVRLDDIVQSNDVDS